jgi:hypothetical protein
MVDWTKIGEPVGKTASELERQHERKGSNIVSLSAARHRRAWNRHVATWSGGDDDHAA